MIIDVMYTETVNVRTRKMMLKKQFVSRVKHFLRMASKDTVVVHKNCCQSFKRWCCRLTPDTMSHLNDTKKQDGNTGGGDTQQTPGYDCKSGHRLLRIFWTRRRVGYTKQICFFIKETTDNLLFVIVNLLKTSILDQGV